MFKNWNHLPELLQLKQLYAILIVLSDKESRFVTLNDLLIEARRVCAENRVSVLPRPVRVDCHDGFSSSQFRPWVEKNIGGPVQVYVHNLQPWKVNSPTRVFFYSRPESAVGHDNLKTEMTKLVHTMAEHHVMNVLPSIDVRGHLNLLPDTASRRVFRSLIQRVAQSKTFSEVHLGLDGRAGNNAIECVDAALALSIQFETSDFKHLTVRSDMTTRAQDAAVNKARQTDILDELCDEHFGGRTSLKEHCTELGLCLKDLIERGTAELGSVSYVDTHSAGESSVSRQRDSTTVMRNCTWESLAKWVQDHIQATEADRGLRTFTTVGRTTLMRYCIQRHARSLQAKRADPIAEVSHRALKSAECSFNVDAHYTHALVRSYEQGFMALSTAQIPTFLRSWDDHSKWEPDKKRGYTSSSTLLLKSQSKVAPYSDMKRSFGGVKGITNSVLLAVPPETEGWQDGRGTSTKRGHEVIKQGYAVTRLENEYRSTPYQQANDWKFLVESDSRVKQLTRDSVAIFSLSDSGWDHDQRNAEVRYFLARDHLESDREYDANYVRAADQSSFNEAERLNGACTKAVTKAQVPTLIPFGRPTTAYEVEKNRRGFQMGIVNSLSTAQYANRPVVSLASYPGVQNCQTYPPTMRIMVREPT